MNHRGAQVLVVEDDADVREAFVIFLETEGYRVVEAANGEEALVQLAENPSCCVILLDLFMPVMDGWTFRFHQLADPRFADIPVIVLSADRLSPATARGLRAAACLMKPVDLDLLMGEIRLHCQGQTVSAGC